jgi:hypothetical protein
MAALFFQVLSRTIPYWPETELCAQEDHCSMVGNPAGELREDGAVGIACCRSPPWLSSHHSLLGASNPRKSLLPAVSIGLTAGIKSRRGGRPEYSAVPKAAAASGKSCGADRHGPAILLFAGAVPSIFRDLLAE